MMKHLSNDPFKVAKAAHSKERKLASDNRKFSTVYNYWLTKMAQDIGFVLQISSQNSGY